MTETERAASQYVQTFQFSDNGKKDMAMSGRARHAFLAGAAWQREQDAILMDEAAQAEFRASCSVPLGDPSGRTHRYTQSLFKSAADVIRAQGPKQEAANGDV